MFKESQIMFGLIKNRHYKINFLSIISIFYDQIKFSFHISLEVEETSMSIKNIEIVSLMVSYHSNQSKHILSKVISQGT